jgi:hypothetical protein
MVMPFRNALLSLIKYGLPSIDPLEKRCNKKIMMLGIGNNIFEKFHDNMVDL